MGLFVCVLVHVRRHNVSFHAFMSLLGETGPLIWARESSPCSPPELCLSVGHLTRATRERLPQPSANPGESIDASIAAGLSSTREPQGELLISINVNWCCPQANTKATHTHIYVNKHAHTYPHMWAGAHMYADVMENWLSSGQNMEEWSGDVVKWQASEWNICSLDAVDASLLPR